MTEESRIKWRVRKNKLKRGVVSVAKALVPFAFGATIGATWFGYVNSIKNSFAIDELNKKVTKQGDIINNNAMIQMHDQDRLNEVTRQTNLLMEKALGITEGKEEDAA